MYICTELPLKVLGGSEDCCTRVGDWQTPCVVTSSWSTVIEPWQTSSFWGGSDFYFLNSLREKKNPLKPALTLEFNGGGGTKKKNPKRQLRKAIHATIPCSLLPPISSSQGWRGVNASGERRQRIVCKRRHQTTHKATAPDTSTLCTEFLSCHKHTCELTHQVLVDKLTSHLQGSPLHPYMAFLQGGGGPSVTNSLHWDCIYKCLLPTMGQRDIFNT